MHDERILTLTHDFLNAALAQLPVALIAAIHCMEMTGFAHLSGELSERDVLGNDVQAHSQPIEVLRGGRRRTRSEERTVMSEVLGEHTG